MTPTSELRDELPPLLREWWDWTTHHMTGWQHVPALCSWAIKTVFVPVMVAGLIGLILAGLWLVAVPGLLIRRGWLAVKPKGEMVPFAARRRG